MFVQVSPSLIKRQKTHFHNLTCGASIILGNNGYIWIYPTPGHQDEEAGGYYTSLEVRTMFVFLFNQAFLLPCEIRSVVLIRFSGSVWFQPIPLSDREVISRLRNCLLALAAHKVMLYDTSILYCYESSLAHQVQAVVSQCVIRVLCESYAYHITQPYYVTMCHVHYRE